MSEKENHNKRTVLRLYEEVGNEGRLEVLDEIAWPDHIKHYPFPGQSQGVEGLKQRRRRHRNGRRHDPGRPSRSRQARQGSGALGSDLGSPVPFLRGKAIAEQYLKDSGLDYTILMPNLFMEIWCPSIVGQALPGGRPVTLIGQGTRKHSMISATDVAAFAVAAAGNERACNRVLVLGGPQPVTWHDVVAA